MSNIIKNVGIFVEGNKHKYVAPAELESGYYCIVNEKYESISSYLYMWIDNYNNGIALAQLLDSTYCIIDTNGDISNSNKVLTLLEKLSNTINDDGSITLDGDNSYILESFGNKNTIH